MLSCCVSGQGSNPVLFQVIFAPKMVEVRKIIEPRHHEVVLWHVLNLEKNLENKLAAPSVGEFGNNRTQTVDTGPW